MIEEEYNEEEDNQTELQHGTEPKPVLLRVTWPGIGSFASDRPQ